VLELPPTIALFSMRLPLCMLCLGHRCQVARRRVCRRPIHRASRSV